MVLLPITYMEMTLTALITAESWGPAAMWPCIQITRKQSRMCNQLVLGPPQTDRLLGTPMASAGAAPEDRRRKCF